MIKRILIVIAPILMLTNSSAFAREIQMPVPEKVTMMDLDSQAASPAT